MRKDPGYTPGAMPGARGSTVGAPPVELYLEISNRCNLRCRTCPQHFGMSEPQAQLTVDDVSRILAQVPRLRRVVLHGIGESTLHPDLPAIVSLVRKRGAYSLLNTNGTLLTRALCLALIEAGLDELRVSVDASTTETYEAVRGGDFLEVIRENLRGLLEVRAGTDTPVVSLWMTATRRAIPELAGLVRIAGELGIPRVYLQRLVTSERGLATASQSLHGEAAPSGEAIRRAEALATELGVELRGSGAGSAAASLKATDDPAPWRGCRRPWELMYVTANGNVLPCCISPFTSAPYTSLVQGNVLERPLAEVWNGAPYQGWRAAMLSGEPPEACRRCGTAWCL